MTEPPKKQFFDMKKDDAEEASIKTDRVNIDFSIEVNKKLDVNDVWKCANQIVTDYFDAIEVADKETSIYVLPGVFKALLKIQSAPG